MTFYGLQAQVTVGSNKNPNSGSLLDLKEYTNDHNMVTSSKGLALPRVKLTDKNNLYPMLENTPGSGTPNSDYQTALQKQEEDKRHVGLIVYNLNQCQGFAKGVYIWKGNEWEQLTRNEGIEVAEILWNDETKMPGTKTIIPILSGLGRQSPLASTQNMKIAWKSAGLTTSITNITNTVGGGLSFSSNPPSGWTTPLSTNPTNFSFGLNNMSNVVDIINKPWQSRETTIKFTTSQDECGDSAERTFVLNQTNYALTVDNSTHQWSPYRNRTSFRHLITVIDTQTFPGWSANYFFFDIASNASWTSKYRVVTPNIISNIVIPSKGGKEVTNYNVAYGNEPTLQRYTPIRNNRSVRTNSSSDSYVAERNQYKTAATLTFYDSIPAPNHRFDSIVVTLIQCAGLPDLSSIQDGDAIPVSDWQDKVLYHKDQSDNRFYSASFGNAGRWMTTNLAATRYADNMGGAPLGVYSGDSLATRNTSARVYGYPRYIHVVNPTQNDTIRKVGAEGWGTPPIRHAAYGQPWYSEQGVLYSWYAATNLNESYILNQGQATPGLELPAGPNEIESIYETTSGAKNGKIQGICPEGWHLPTDREWNELERELYNNPKKYSDYTDDLINTFNPATWNPNFETARGWRGGSSIMNEGYAGVFKEICPVRDFEANFSVYSYGYSKEPALGGFNVMCVGWGMGPMMHTYYGSARFWTSSGIVNGAWTRGFTYDFGQVMRLHTYKYMLQSVRCKKDD